MNAIFRLDSRSAITTGAAQGGGHGIGASINDVSWLQIFITDKAIA
jgi:hypothetical protein